jgi:hypothetical protein
MASPSLFIAMQPHLDKTRSLIRRVTCFILPPFLIITAAILLVTQFTELATQNEILSLTSFLVLLSFSALAFNWCRVSTISCTEADLDAVYEVGVDLFLSSMMALIAAFFVWLQVGASGVFVMLTPIFFTMHWIFLLLSLLLFLVAIFHLLEVVKRGKVMKSRS